MKNKLREFQETTNEICNVLNEGVPFLSIKLERLLKGK